MGCVFPLASLASEKQIFLHYLVKLKFGKVVICDCKFMQMNMSWEWQKVDFQIFQVVVQTSEACQKNSQAS